MSARVTLMSGPRLLRELMVITLSVVGAVVLVRSGVVESLMGSTTSIAGVGSLVAGLGYSSIFTVAPATAALAEIARYAPVWQVALIGGIGASLTDQLLYRAVRSELITHVSARLRQQWARRVRKSPWRWTLVTLGALVIASPLPDELGLAMMGAGQLPSRWFLVITLPLNVLGIWLIGQVARQL